MISLEYTHVLDTQYHVAKNIIVVGAGGTGGYLIPNLARQIALQNQIREVEGLSPHILTIIEKDEVELKNLTRQNFIQRDIDKNKGQVLAERYGQAFGLNINYIQEYITDSEQLPRIISAIQSSYSNSFLPIVVDCVDNNKTRMLIEESCKYISNHWGQPIFYISSGNEEWAGQVVCSFLPTNESSTNRRIARTRSSGVNLFRTPLLSEIYPEVKTVQDKLPDEMSCAERAVSAPQNILTNMVAANLQFTFLNTILTAKSSEGEGLKHFLVNFDAQHSVYSTYFNQASVVGEYI